MTNPSLIQDPFDSRLTYLIVPINPEGSLEKDAPVRLFEDNIDAQYAVKDSIKKAKTAWRLLNELHRIPHWKENSLSSEGNPSTMVYENGSMIMFGSSVTQRSFLGIPRNKSVQYFVSLLNQHTAQDLLVMPFLRKSSPPRQPGILAFTQGGHKKLSKTMLANAFTLENFLWAEKELAAKPNRFDTFGRAFNNANQASPYYGETNGSS